MFLTAVRKEVVAKSIKLSNFIFNITDRMIIIYILTILSCTVLLITLLLITSLHFFKSTGTRSSLSKSYTANLSTFNF